MPLNRPYPDYGTGTPSMDPYYLSPAEEAELIAEEESRAQAQTEDAAAEAAAAEEDAAYEAAIAAEAEDDGPSMMELFP